MDRESLGKPKSDTFTRALEKEMATQCSAWRNPPGWEAAVYRGVAQGVRHIAASSQLSPSKHLPQAEEQFDSWSREATTPGYSLNVLGFSGNSGSRVCLQRQSPGRKGNGNPSSVSAWKSGHAQNFCGHH